MTLQVHTLRYGNADWIDTCSRSLEAWCDRHGYELILWDDSHGLEVPKFIENEMVAHFNSSDARRMLYVDADVFVHPDAPAFPATRGLSIYTDQWHAEHNPHFREWVTQNYPNINPAKLKDWEYSNAGVWALDRASAVDFLRIVDNTPQIEFFQDQHWFNACAYEFQLRGGQVTQLSGDWNRYGRDWEPSWFYHLWGHTKLEDLAALRERGLLEPRDTRGGSHRNLIHNVQHGTPTEDKVVVLEFIQDCGLGNQMFEWAAGYSISKSLGLPFTWVWNPSGLREFELGAFGIGEPPRKKYPKVMQRMGQGSRRLYELAKQRILSSPERICAISCPFQDEQCFIDYKDEIRERFTLAPFDLPHPHGTIPVGVQVRRGDYINHKRLDVVTPDYFANAMKWMVEKVPNAHFIIVSDDPTWCSQIFGYREDVTVMPPQDSITGLRTLASCKAHIISNSTFGWWGAWLGETGPVVVPEVWHNGGKSYGDWNPIPDRWHRVSLGKRQPRIEIEPMAPIMDATLPSHDRAIVYPWHADAERWHELRYSLRSVYEFFEDKECPIYILGTRKPGWLVETDRVKYIGAFTYREALTKGVQIAEKVLWMNDDIVLLRDTGWAECEKTLYLKGIAPAFLEQDRTNGNPWRAGCLRILRALAAEGIRDQKVFSTHTPYVYERDKALDVMRRYGVWEKFPMELAYFHHHAVEPTRVDGTWRAEGLPFGEARFLNYSDRTLTPELKREIVGLLPNRPRWELELNYGV